MVVSTVKEAWQKAKELLKARYVKNEVASYRAGYPIYVSTVNDDDSIADFGARLEVVVDEVVTNIWIAALCTEVLGEKIDEETEKEAEEISNYIVLKKYDIKTYANEFDKNIVFQVAVQALKKMKRTYDKEELQMICNEATATLGRIIEECNTYQTIYVPLQEIIEKWEKEKTTEKTNIERVEEYKNMTKSELVACLEEELQILKQAAEDVGWISDERYKLSKQIFQIATYLLEIKKEVGE